MTAEEILARSAETDRFWSDGKPRCECSGGSCAHLHEDEDGRCLEQDGEKALGFAGDVELVVVGAGEPRAMCGRCAPRRRADAPPGSRRRKEPVGPAMVPLFGGGA